MSTSPTSFLYYCSLPYSHFPSVATSSKTPVSVPLRSRSCRSIRFAARASSHSMEPEVLQKGIAEFYDESSGIWEDIWGDHMHHGFYDPDSIVSVSDHHAAQIRMIEEALRFSAVSDHGRECHNQLKGIGAGSMLPSPDLISLNIMFCIGAEKALTPNFISERLEDPTKWPKAIVDVGCGIGGSSRYMAKKFGAKSIGITLSPVQAARANALSASQGLADQVSFQVADALKQPFLDGQFDLVWSMESGEHMPDKAKFVGELTRVAAPGGTIIIVTWCHRDLGPSEEPLKPWEENLLKKICDSYYLPAWCSTADYVRLLESLSLQNIKSADWSPFVAPFWPAVIRSALTWKGLASLLRSGLKTIKGALAMPLMIEGYKKGLIKFAVITCQKPK